MVNTQMCLKRKCGCCWAIMNIQGNNVCQSENTSSASKRDQRGQTDLGPFSVFRLRWLYNPSYKLSYSEEVSPMLSVLSLRPTTCLLGSDWLPALPLPCFLGAYRTESPSLSPFAWLNECATEFCHRSSSFNWVEFFSLFLGSDQCKALKRFCLLIKQVWSLQEEPNTTSFSFLLLFLTELHLMVCPVSLTTEALCKVIWCKMCVWSKYLLISVSDLI